VWTGRKVEVGEREFRRIGRISKKNTSQSIERKQRLFRKLERVEEEEKREHEKKKKKGENFKENVEKEGSSQTSRPRTLLLSLSTTT